jgi:hypothetical protein
LSKLLNQEDALSAPCFSRAGLTRHFWCHISVCYTQLITQTSADELPVVGGIARVERTDARSSRAVVKTALTCGFLLPK